MKTCTKPQDKLKTTTDKKTTIMLTMDENKRLREVSRKRDLTMVQQVRRWIKSSHKKEFTEGGAPPRKIQSSLICDQGEKGGKV